MKALTMKPDFVIKNGKPVAVILPLSVYKEFLELAEDKEDARWLCTQQKKKLHFRKLDDFLAKRKKHV